MSYCVHCGVELSDAEKECPLCRTPVLDPHREGVATDSGYFPLRSDPGRPKLNRKFWIFLISLLMLIPFAAVILIDLLTTPGLTWSLYVLGAEICCWTFFVLPCLRRLGIYPCLGMDMAAGAAYLLLIAICSGYMEWYVSLALPIVCETGIAIGIGIWILGRKAVRLPGRLGWIGILSALFLTVLDGTIHRASAGTVMPCWSWYASVPLLVFGVALLIFSRSARIGEWIRKNMFV